MERLSLNALELTKSQEDVSEELLFRELDKELRTHVETTFFPSKERIS